MNEPEAYLESGGEESPPGSQPWTMEYVARLFIEAGGFQGIANTHNAILERAKAETEPASDLVLNSHGNRLTKHHICIAQNMGEPLRRNPSKTMRKTGECAADLCAGGLRRCA